MPRKLILTLLIAAALGACAPAVFTPSPALATREGATALAAANAMLTATHEAIPTRQRPTLVPPPQTPPGFSFRGTAGAPPTGSPVTDTPVAGLALTAVPLTGTAAAPSSIPVTGASATAAAASASAGCDHVLDAAAAGPSVQLIIRNDTRAPISFSMGLSAPNSFGQCGYLSWPPIPGSSKLVVDVPQTRPASGDPCYWAYALVNDPNDPTTVSHAGFCLAPSRRWAFDVGYNRITLNAQ